MEGEGQGGGAGEGERANYTLLVEGGLSPVVDSTHQTEALEGSTCVPFIIGHVDIPLNALIS